MSRAKMAGMVFGVIGGFVLPSLLLAAPAPHLYVAPTAGIWRWDGDAIAGYALDSRSGFLWGGRVGYAPIEAFSGELVVITGSLDFTGPGGVVLDVRNTQVEASFLVNFQALVSSPVYPFLDLGAGISLRRAEDPSVLDDSKFVFHIGGGLKADLDPRLALRLNVRDTFFNDSQDVGNEEKQVTVDSVELSLGLEYRLSLGRRAGPTRLR